MLSESAWLTWDQLYGRANEKRVIFFGAGEWVDKTKPYLPREADYIVDNNRYEQGQRELGLDIFSPEKLRDENWNEILVIITTSGFMEVSEQLTGYGLKSGVHFVVSPSLKNYETIARVNQNHQVVYLTCSDQFLPDSSERGGGLYRYDITSGKVDKLINGLCHGIVEGNENIYLVDDLVGIRILDKQFQTQAIVELPEKSRPHGIAHSEELQRLYVNLSGRDSIGVIDLKAGKLEREIFLSDKWQRSLTAQHHMNDLCCYGDSLFVSMFSRSGNWKRGVYDGAIVEVDVVSEEVRWTVVRDLWFPHTPVVIKGLLHYCDSMRGTVHNSTWKNIAAFNGFVRGIAHDGRFYYIGQSMHRYVDRVGGTTDNISLDTGFFVVDDASKATKFFGTPQLTDINAVMVLRQD